MFSLPIRLYDYTSGKSSDEEEAAKDSLTDCDEIAIIGAEITRSYAAWRLRGRNLKISLSEYSGRIGGRCFTVQLLGKPDVNVEIGAMMFSPNDPRQYMTHDWKLSIFALGYDSSGGSLYYLRGKHIRREELPTEAPYNLPAENRADLDTLYWYMYK